MACVDRPDCMPDDVRITSRANASMAVDPASTFLESEDASSIVTECRPSDRFGTSSPSPEAFAKESGPIMNEPGDDSPR